MSHNLIIHSGTHLQEKTEGEMMGRIEQERKERVWRERQQVEIKAYFIMTLSLTKPC